MLPHTETENTTITIIHHQNTSFQSIVLFSLNMV